VRSQKLRLWLRWIEIGLAEPVIKKTPAKLMPSQARIKVYDKIVLVGEIRCDGLNRAHRDCLSVYDDRGIRGWRHRELFQEVGDRAVVRECHQSSQSVRGRRRKTRARGGQSIVLEFVRPIHEEFIADDRPARTRACPVIIEAIFFSALLFQ